MKLSRKVNLILLPVILIVFGMCALLIIEENQRQGKIIMQQKLQSQLMSIQHAISRQARQLESNLNQLLAVRELSMLRSEADTQASLPLEDLILKNWFEWQRELPALEAMRIYDTRRQLLFSADNRGPFEAPVTIHIPSHLHWWQPSSRPENRITRQFYLHSENSEQPRLVLLAPFIPEMGQIQLPMASNAEQTLFALIELRLDEIRIPDKFRLKMIAQPASPNKQKISPQDQLITKLSASAEKAEAIAPLYRLELTFHEQYERRYLNQITLGLMLLIALFAFALLSILIRHQILNPITQLSKRVQHLRGKHPEELQYRSDNDEVARLNNAYVDLVNDINKLASYDSLTKLANRRYFQITLDHHIARCMSESSSLALLFIDLDNFKRVNDTFGHDTGDQLLRTYAYMLQQRVNSHTDAPAIQVARLAGDEFAVLFDVPSTESAASVAASIIDITRNGMEIEGVWHNVHSSAGLAFFPEDAKDGSCLLRFADAAMYQAKQTGKGCFRIFNASIASEIYEYDLIESHLKEALDQEYFELYLQPIYDARSEQIIAAEALLRCHHPILKQYGPARFIPIAEQTGFIRELDLWVIRQALEYQLQLHQKHGFTGKMNINFSASELHNDLFSQQVARLLAQHPISPDCIELEVTETALVDCDTQALEVLDELKALGISIALDDFGTGYTSFNQLMNYAADILKIDRSFVSTMLTEEAGQPQIPRIIIELARMFNLRVVAEGVETEAQMRALQTLGCDYLQGYYLSPPLTLDDFIQQLSRSEVSSSAAE